MKCAWKNMYVEQFGYSYEFISLTKGQTMTISVQQGMINSIVIVECATTSCTCSDYQLKASLHMHF